MSTQLQQKCPCGRLMLLEDSREALTQLLMTARGTVDADIAIDGTCIDQAAAILGIELPVGE